jgi:hypothetical protein
MSGPSLIDRVGDLRQVASVRRIMLLDGPEAGVEALAFSTGGGLDFTVLAGRSLDIGTVHYRGVPMAWQSAMGFRSGALVNAESDGGRGFGRGFSGFLVTCGLEHMRQPRDGHPLHGRLPFTPARLIAAGEDWEREVPVLYCEGEVVQAMHGGEALKLRRRIEAPIGGTGFSIADRVENAGHSPQAHGVLYHFNLGFPAVQDGTTVHVGETRVTGPLELSRAGLSGARCHDGAGGEAVLTTPVGDGEPLTVRFGFDAATLPFLQVWEDLRARTGVLSVEPVATGMSADGVADGPIMLAPGETRRYSLHVGFGGTPPDIGPVGRIGR